MWTEKAKAFCEKIEISNEQDRFVGYHDGYTRLKDAVVHRREVIFNKKKLQFVVNDLVGGDGRHQVERFWHFSEKCSVRLTENELRIENKRSTIRMKPLEPKCRVELHRGNEDLPIGWVSRRYDVKEPCFSAIFKNEINGPTAIQTVIQIQMEH